MSKYYNKLSTESDSIQNDKFEKLLELQYLDIKPYLDSYLVANVDNEDINSTINILKLYMPKQKL